MLTVGRAVCPVVNGVDTGQPRGAYGQSEPRNAGCHRCFKKSRRLKIEAHPEGGGRPCAECGPRRGDLKNDRHDWVAASEVGGGGGQWAVGLEVPVRILISLLQKK